jgi:resuscitation-promoting factor RpfA
MTSRPDSRLGRKLVRMAVVGAVAISAPLAVAGTANAAPSSTWDKLAKCESGGNWKINTGNGYYGGLQFSPRTWRAHGGKGMPHQASKGEQIRVAERILANQGWKAWPSCSKKLGLGGRD